MEVLERTQIVKQTRAVGRSQMYRLNEENPVVRKLIELDAQITEMCADRAAEEELKIPVQVKRRK